MSQYGKMDYWEERYIRDPEPFDWYQRYASVKDILLSYVQPENKILIIGAGNSRMGEEMLEDGFGYITNIDFSQTVIKQMQEKYKDKGQNFKYQLMDMKQMEFQDGSFQCVLDKGTLDCILCGENSPMNIEKALNEIYRVLSPSGVYIYITYGQPEHREPHLKKVKQTYIQLKIAQSKYEWEITLKKVQKPMVSTSITIAADDKDASNFHYIYICKKKQQQNQIGEK